MTKRIYIVIAVLITQVLFSQKAQKIGYVDSAYILENIPAYTKAQSKLDAKISNWNSSLNKLKSEIEKMRLTLGNEAALLTETLIEEREEDITIKELAFKKKQESFFGTSGDLFMLRKQLVKPIQDQIFNAIKEIVTVKKYDIIFDKSGNDVVMLYTNPKYDISELVLQKIVKGRKKKENAEKKEKKLSEREKKKEELKTKLEARKIKQEKLRERIKKQKEVKAAKRAADIKANAAKRAKRIADEKAKKEALKNKTQKKEFDKKAIDTPKEAKKETDEQENKAEVNIPLENKEIPKTKAQLKKEKRAMLMERINKNKARKDSLRKVKNKKKIEDTKERRKKENENN